MSFKFYSKLWVSTKHDLVNVLQQEHTIETLPPTKDRLFAHRVVASIFPRYIVLCNNLFDLYDQTLQVQKRKVIETLLEATTCRLKELHKQLCDIEMSEIVYVDRTLIEHKLSPQDITILQPFYDPSQRTTQIQNLLDDTTKKKSPIQETEQTELTGLDKYRVKLTPEQIEQQRIHTILVDAINLIKSHEKARQSRIWKNNIDSDPLTYKPQMRPGPKQISYQFYYKPDTVMLTPIKRTSYSKNPTFQDLISFSNFKFYKKPEIVNDNKPQFGRSVKKKAEKVIVEVPVEIEDRSDETTVGEESSCGSLPNERRISKEILNQSACVIQKAWFRYKLKQKITQEKLKKLLVFGMADERKYDFSSENKIKESKEKRRARKASFDTAFIQAVEEEKARILKVKSPWLMEDISDQVREWFREFYYSVKGFDRYPEVFEGGTILVIRGDTMDPEEFKVKQAQMAAEKGRTPEQKAKEKEKIKAEKEKAKEKKRQEKLKKKQEMKRRKALEKQGLFQFDFKKEPEEREKAPIGKIYLKNFQRHNISKN